MTEKKIKISQAKGRPMLQWIGKEPLEFVKSFPAQLVETFNQDKKSKPLENPTFEDLEKNWQNLIFHGDNKEVLGCLLANGFRGEIDLIYIDPPFDSGADYIRKIELRGIKDKEKIEGEKHSLGEQVQYFDIWSNDNYLQYMYERLQLMKELLSDKGSFFLHCDWHKVHHLRAIMDEIFGQDNFRNEIIWFYPNTSGRAVNFFPRKHDVILFYTKSKNAIFNKEEAQIPVSEGTKSRAKYARIMGGRTYENKDYSDTHQTKLIEDVWNIAGAFTGSENVQYPTQKPEKILDLIIGTCSKENSIILDCFMGSGTTQAVAQKLNRRWIGADINKGSIQTTIKRLQKIIKNQKDIKYSSFSHYKVNDYDLQLLRTEAIELAIQHLGIERNKTDLFFEGILGNNLVKIIDFNHPLTLLDIQLIQDELKKRPNDNRDVTIVCLGKEIAIDSWVETYNKKHSVNKFNVIELRTDDKYGKFLIHKPTQSKVDIKRKGEKAIIEIKGFISPSIIERLNDKEKLIKVKIPDFRSMIDVILIDNNYNGKVFNITHSDVPEKKNDLVEGKYEVEIPKKETTIAVKIIDMLGEEVLIIKEI